MIVVDNDVLSYFWLGTGRTAAAKRARRIDPEWAAPVLWRSEFRHVLRGYMRQGALSFAEALWFVEKAERSMRGREYQVISSDVLKLVEQTGHSAYDCEYVALAQQLGVPLLTGDKELVGRLPETAVLLETYADS